MGVYHGLSKIVVPHRMHVNPYLWTPKPMEKFRFWAQIYRSYPLKMKETWVPMVVMYSLSSFAGKTRYAYLEYHKFVHRIQSDNILTTWRSIPVSK